MARQAARLHLLTVREVQTAREGDHSDGGNLILRVREGSATWVFRYTSNNGKRRELGLGTVERDNATLAGRSLTDGRDRAGAARKQLRMDVGPIDAREDKRKADRQAETEEYKDAPALFSRLRRTPGTAARCLELAILTASRTSEALSVE